MDKKPLFLQGRGRGRGRGATALQTPVRPGDQSKNSLSPTHRQGPTPIQPMTNKYQDVVEKHQEAVKRHLSKNGDGEMDLSSSEEEEDEANDEGILQSMFKSFKATNENGSMNDLERTQEYLMSSMKAKSNACLVCLETIKKTEAIWCCRGCFAMFHIPCIQKWVKEGAYINSAFEEDQSKMQIPWCCPKCRHEYKSWECPTQYYCFCGKEENPVFDPWLVPHSCGQVCGKALKPECGHTCLLLCHPGPCPPCPQMVQAQCNCGQQRPQTRRCGDKIWSCGQACSRPLQCGHHQCQTPCHTGDCPPCPRTSNQPCNCGGEVSIRPCASLSWQCTKVCGQALDCGHHTCEEICHKGACPTCPRAGLRSCPCGKSKFSLPCTEDVPTCMETCEKLLPCGLHSCAQRCHAGPCGICRELKTKSCRCGKKSKSVLCHKEYLCETKCLIMKDCKKHPCKRKCCDGNCPPCELQCGKMLGCRNHKCASTCHRGACFPCPLTVKVSCQCCATSVTVPCGREKITQPPRCKLPCKIKPDCHHTERDKHHCHFGRCPPCQQVCKKNFTSCKHTCPQRCHSAVLTKIQQQDQRAGPWEPRPTCRVEVVDKPCPPCAVPLPTTCLGKHEMVNMACSIAKVSSCHRPCGRSLACTNHTCQLECHEVVNAPSAQTAGSTCGVCEEVCNKPQPEGCTHACLLPCHPGHCPPCQLRIRMRCHCQLVVRHIECDEWTHADDLERQRLQSCQGRCPKTLACGHNCKALCHPGPCPNPERCTEKVKVRCPCRRLKSEYLCNEVQAGEASVACDESCEQHKARVRKEKEEEAVRKKAEEEEKLQNELATFERRKGGRKRKPRKERSVEQPPTFLQRYAKILVAPLLVILLAVFVYYLLNK